jgi:hypothetical protein
MTQRLAGSGAMPPASSLVVVLPTLIVAAATVFVVYSGVNCIVATPGTVVGIGAAANSAA